MSLLLNLLDDMLFSAIPALGFALLFNVPPNALKYCTILGAIGHTLRTLLLLCDIPIVFATLIASSFIGFIGVYLSHHYLAHPKVFTVAAIIPMIPGVYAYKAMISILHIYTNGYSVELMGRVIEFGLKTGFILAALVFGLALPGLLFYRNKPVI